jgi:hypothetical protein
MNAEDDVADLSRMRRLLSRWKLIEQEHHSASSPDTPPYSFLTYER